MVTRCGQPVQISAAGPADAEAIAGLIRDVYLPFARDFQPTALRWTARLLAEQAGSWRLARSAGTLIGVVRLDIEDVGYTFDTLAVAVPWRRRGVGTRLAAVAREWALDAGAERLVVILRDSLAANVAFFTALGYTRGERYSPHHHIFTKEIR
jgi:GNAT superfamily N-acetyltransferase